jgi:hypothetical protein
LLRHDFAVQARAIAPVATWWEPEALKIEAEAVASARLRYEDWTGRGDTALGRALKADDTGESDAARRRRIVLLDALSRLPELSNDDRARLAPWIDAYPVSSLGSTGAPERDTARETARIQTQLAAGFAGRAAWMQRRMGSALPLESWVAMLRDPKPDKRRTAWEKLRGSRGTGGTWSDYIARDCGLRTLARTRNVIANDRFAANGKPFANHFDARLADHGLTRVEWLALRTVLLESTASEMAAYASDLAARLGVETL